MKVQADPNMVLKKISLCALLIKVVLLNSLYRVFLLSIQVLYRAILLSTSD
jgi:hypothetical protein